MRSRGGVVGLAAALVLGVVPATAGGANAAEALPPVDQLSTPDQRSDTERVVVTPAGEYVAAWIERTPEGARVYTATRTGTGSWSDRRLMGSGTTVELAASSTGEVLVVWPGAVAVRSAGGDWSDAEAVPTGYVEEVVAAPDGSFAVANVGSTQVVVRRADGTWSDPQALNPAPIWPVEEASPARALAPLPGGGFVAAWTSELDPAEPELPEAALQAAVASADGTWSAPVLLTDEASRHTRLDLEVGRDGTVAIRYLKTDGERWVVARHAGAWSAPATAPPGQITATPEGFGSPLMSVAVVDGNDSGDSLRTWASTDGSTWVPTELRVALPEDTWFFLSLAVGQDDVVVVARSLVGARSLAQAVTFTDTDQGSAPTLLGSRTGEFGGVLTATRQGGYVFVAPVWGESGYPIAASFRSPGGGWSALTTVVTGVAVDPYYPFAQVAAHEDTASIVWSQTQVDENEQEVRFRVLSVVATPSASAPALPPLVTMARPIARFQTRLTFPVAWRVQSTAGPTTVEVRRTTTRWDGRTATATHRLANGATFTGLPGRTYCFTARATDTLAQTGDWSTPTCTTTPVDDRTLTPRGDWTNTRTNTAYLGTLRVTRQRGATLTLRNVEARRLALLTTVGPRAGTITVTHAGRTLGTWKLARTTTRPKVVLPLATYRTTRDGTLRIRVTSNGRPVRIDGLYTAP